MKKKRLLSMLLCLCTVFSLFAGTCATASADDGLIKHTVREGQWLSWICSKYGLTYSKCWDAIRMLNPSVTNPNLIYPGQVITLPASDAVAATVQQTTTTTTTTTVNGSQVSSSTTSTGTSNLKNGDTIAYYLIPYTMKSGDTVAKVCASLGVSYAANWELIKNINGIPNLNYVWAGKTLYFPSNKVPTSGAYYVVVNHKVNSGETMTKICADYGTSFLGNYKMVEGLNGNANLNRILVGQSVYVPALSSVVFSGGNNGGNNSGSNGGSNNNTPAESGYLISFENGVGGSAYAVNTNGQKITRAEAGASVTIMPNAKYGYAQESIAVLYESTATQVPSDGNTFVMPASDVRVKVVYSGGKLITDVASKGGTFETQVNGVDVGSAVFGNTVVVVPNPDNGYAVETIVYSYVASDPPVTISREVKLKNGVYSFTMPDSAVTVSVSFKTAPSWSIHKGDLIKNGVVVASIDGAPVNKATAGQVVSVEAVPEEGFMVYSLTVEDSKGGIVDVELEGNGASGHFIMPEKSVTVNATFVSSKQYYIYPVTTCDGKPSESSKCGDIVFMVDGKATWKAREGDEVTIVTSPKTGFTQDLNGTFVKLKSNSSDVNTLKRGLNTFIMPGAEVNVTVDFASGAHAIKLGKLVNGKLITKVNGIEAKNAQENDQVFIKVDPSVNYDLIENSLVVSYTSVDNKGKVTYEKLTVKNNGIKQEASTGEYYFTMPNYDVVINADFELAATHKLKAEAWELDPKTKEALTNDPIEGTDLAKIFDITFRVKGVAVDNVTANNEVVVEIDGIPGTVIDHVMLSNGKTAELQFKDGKYSFTMNKNDALVSVYFYNELYEVLASDAGQYEFFIFDDPDNDNFTAMTEPLYKYKDVVGVGVLPETGYKLEGVKFISEGKELDYEVVYDGGTGGEMDYKFSMPAADVVVKGIFSKVAIPLYKQASANGSITFSVGKDSNASSACVGDIVKIIPECEIGFELAEVKTDPEITVKKSSDGSYWYFTVPEGATVIKVTPKFAERSYILRADEIAEEIGNITFEYDGTGGLTYEEVPFKGDVTVTVVVRKPIDGTTIILDKLYVNNEEIVFDPADPGISATDDTDADGNEIIVYKYDMKMPATDTLISATFKGDVYTITYNDADYKFTNKSDKGFALEGTTVYFTVHTFDPKGAIGTVVITNEGGTDISGYVGLVYDKKTGMAHFIMPACNVEIDCDDVTYAATAMAAKHGKIALTKSGGNTHESFMTIAEDEEFYIVVEPADGYRLATITIKDLDGNVIDECTEAGSTEIVPVGALPGPITSYKYTTPTPGQSIEVYATFIPVNNFIVHIDGCDPAQVESISLNGTAINVKNGGFLAATAGTKVKVVLNMKPGLKPLDLDIKLKDVGGNEIATVEPAISGDKYTYTFTMPHSDVYISDIGAENKEPALDNLFWVANGSVSKGKLHFTDKLAEPVTEAETINQVKLGTIVYIIPVGANTNYEIDPASIEIFDAVKNVSTGMTVASGDIQAELDGDGNPTGIYYFTMPGFSVRVNAKFVSKVGYYVKVTDVLPDSASQGKISIGYSDKEKNKPTSFKDITSVNSSVYVPYGKWVWFRVTCKPALMLEESYVPAFKYDPSGTSITPELVLDTSKSSWAYFYKFQMLPASESDEGVTVEMSSDPVFVNKPEGNGEYTATIKFGGKLTVNYGDGPVIGTSLKNIKVGTDVTITPEQSNVKFVKIRNGEDVLICYMDGDGNVVDGKNMPGVNLAKSGNEFKFTMPDYRVYVEVAFGS